MVDKLDAIIEKHGRKDEVRPPQVVVEFLGLAKKFADEAYAEDKENPPYLAGKAVAYFRAAEKLAKAVCPEVLQNPVFASLLKRITPLSNQHRELPKDQPVKTTRDPILEEVEELVMEDEKEQKTRELVLPTPPHAKTGFTDTAKFNKLIEVLKKKGIQNEKCVQIAFSIFDESKTIEQMLLRLLR